MDNDKILSKLHEKFCYHRDTNYLLTDRLDNWGAMRCAINELEEEEAGLDIYEKFEIEGNKFFVLTDHGFDFLTPISRFRADFWNHTFGLNVEEDQFKESDLDEVYKLLAYAKQEQITVKKLFGIEKTFLSYDLESEFFVVPFGTNIHKAVAIYLATTNRVKHTKLSFLAFHKAENVKHALDYAKGNNDNIIVLSQVLGIIDNVDAQMLDAKNITNDSFSKVNTLWVSGA